MPRKTNGRPSHSQCGWGGRGRQPRQEQRNTRPKYSRLSDHLSTLSAELAFRLAARATSERTAHTARLAIDALILAEVVHRLASALWLEGQAGA
jgi:hypothetical protein